MNPAPRAAYVAEPPAQYLVRPPVVIDCSMLSAVYFDEAERGDALRLMAGRHLLAPQILSDEFVSVALKKLRKGMPEAAVLRALADFSAQDIELHPVDPLQQCALAVRYALSAYDAAYLCLAAELKTPLLTFDAHLGAAAQRHLQALDSEPPA